MEKINLKAPAKINLFLRALRKRPDGYHDIDSLMQAVSLYDEITLEKSADIELECEGLGDVKPEANLAYKAAKLTAGLAYFPGVRITLKKNIPAGAGLGGGSSDAAFVIKGLIELYVLRLDKNELIRQAASLGADIPFFLGHGQARVSGKGDVIEDCFLPRNYKILIVKPPLAIATKEAYRALEIAEPRGFPLTKIDNFLFLKNRMTEADFIRLAKGFSNDFEEVVFRSHPELIQVKQILYEKGAFYSGLSGSGSAIFGLFPPNSNIEKISWLFPIEKVLIFMCKPVLLLKASS